MMVRQRDHDALAPEFFELTAWRERHPGDEGEIERERPNGRDVLSGRALHHLELQPRMIADERCEQMP